ncbi:hypothetical protein GGX14DRAFT_397076 [Mycena pura]|uniref:Tat pathway signal sequence n=1 Tax=Mycena pura TaxID=153505 RepID=A0AAD6Y8Z6_9AGAR|nr:hypothetical protein GGX14DRAFT_397076 [Mycena pura]
MAHGDYGHEDVEPLLLPTIPRPKGPHGRFSDSMRLKVIIALQFALIAGLICTAILPTSRSSVAHRAAGDAFLYSPAQEAVEYELVKFSSGSIFQAPPSDEVDAAWDRLYQFGVSAIPKSQAALLPNKTYPLSYNTSEYVVQLEVFHQLHCLNQIRKGLNFDYYAARLDKSGAALLKPGHLAHCIDSIRQSLMCAADTSPIVWQWSPERKRATTKFDIVHSCRRFESVVDWAWQRHIKSAPDFTQEIEDDIVIPEF